MSATPAKRTVVGGDSTSQEGQDYIHNFPIDFSTLGGVAKWHIGLEETHSPLSEAIELFDNNDIKGKHCVEVALFGCKAFCAAAHDLDACHLLHFARKEVQKLQRLNAKKDSKLNDGNKKNIKSLEDNRDWLGEIVALWKALKAQGYIQ